jgi:hypothetical protein
MRRYAVLLAALALTLVACGNDESSDQKTEQPPEPPPTQIVLVVTATPGPSSEESGTPVKIYTPFYVVVTATPKPDTHTPGTPEPSPTPVVIVVTATPEPDTNTPDTEVGTEPTERPTRRSTRTPTERPTRSPTRRPTITPTPLPASATPLPAIFPTNTVAQVQVAEQQFERGRMFWIRHTRQIWVMQASADNPNGGDWYCYDDTFQEGEPEIDPNLEPPEGLLQPRRGFGKLWRDNPQLQDGLGWATTPEFELTSNYTYIAGGYVEGDQYFPGLGEHRLTTYDNKSISFFEGEIRGDCPGGTWRMAPDS